MGKGTTHRPSAAGPLLTRWLTSITAKRSYFLSVYEAMSVNMAHKIEHTTNDNLRLQYWKASKNAREERPREITNKITSEFYLTKPLKSIVEFNN